MLTASGTWPSRNSSSSRTSTTSFTAPSSSASRAASGGTSLATLRAAAIMLARLSDIAPPRATGPRAGGRRAANQAPRF